MLFDEKDFDINMAFFMPDIKLTRDRKILEPEEGFLRGNMFKDEYIPYKNLTYFKLEPKNEKERNLYKVMALSFALNDLNLYLDLHPDNEEVFSLFKKYVDEYKKALKEYNVDAATAGNMVNEFNYIEEIYAWAVFSYDHSTDLIRGSIRSRGPIVNETASHFGGGGHIFASGVRLKDFDETDLLIKELDEVCRNYKEK